MARVRGARTHDGWKIDETETVERTRVGLAEGERRDDEWRHDLFPSRWWEFPFAQSELQGGWTRLHPPWRHFSRLPRV